MGRNYSKAVDDIIEDATEHVKKDLRNISKQIKKDFIEEGKSTLDAYYADYTPKVYVRTENLKKNSLIDFDSEEGSLADIDITFNTLNGNGFGAGIQFSAEKMANYKKGSKSAVLSNFMAGIHGKPTIKISTSAMSLMEKFQDNYKKTLDGYFISLGYEIK